MKKFVSIFVAVVMTLLSVTIPVSAKSSTLVSSHLETEYTNSTQTISIVQDTRDEFSVSSISDENIFHYNVYTNGELDYTLEVDLTGDSAIVEFVDGQTIMYTISETVTLEKNPDSAVRMIEDAGLQDHSQTLQPYASTNYIDNEPFEITSTGAQCSLGTTTYSGYETMGSITYYLPTESGYLQRKNAGFTSFDSYRFTISAGTLWGAAVGIIVSLATAGGTIVASTVVSALLSSLTGAAVGSVIDSYLAGTFECREYRWDYRVRLNSNTGTILKSVSKYRYWWVMRDNYGNAAFEYRNDIRDGWLLSNRELIANALGR